MLLKLVFSMMFASSAFSVTNAPMCREVGDRCDSSYDCCSGICSVQTCSYNPSGSDACQDSGQTCSTDGECCSGYCASYGACQ